MTAAAFDPVKLARQFPNLGALVDAERCERDLSYFYRSMWAIVDPSPYVHGWVLDCLADHLMGVTDGDIDKLLINVPFRTGKSMMVSVAWPAWTWAQGPKKKNARSGPQVRFMCLSYAQKLSLKHAMTHRRLIASKWYQDRWGDRVKITPDQDNKEEFQTLAGGGRVSLGFDGGSMGQGGDIKIIDDPHKIQGLESEEVRTKTLSTYDEALSSRFTDPKTHAEVIVMQRLHGNDLSAHVLDKFRGHTHVCLPMEYDPRRHCVTVLRYERDPATKEPVAVTWEDPRGCDAEGNQLEGREQRRGEWIIIPDSPIAKRENRLLWPKRFDAKTVEALKTALGPYASAGQLNQIPVPRGGGLIHEEWWQPWSDDVLPDFSFVLISVDTAETENELNDEAGITAWGIWHGDKGMPLVMLINAWEGRLEISKLVAKIAEMAKKHKADTVLIEAKSNGISVINEIRRLYGRREWMTVPFDPKGDKVARLLSVQPHFSGVYRVDPQTQKGAWVDGVIHAPNRDFAQLVIDRCANFPKVKQKALVDTTSQALLWLRQRGHIQTPEEFKDEQEQEEAFVPQKKPHYDV